MSEVIPSFRVREKSAETGRMSGMCVLSFVSTNRCSLTKSWEIMMGLSFFLFSFRCRKKYSSEKVHLKRGDWTCQIAAVWGRLNIGREATCNGRSKLNGSAG
jgi:hypothetical protein